MIQSNSQYQRLISVKNSPFTIHFQLQRHKILTKILEKKKKVLFWLHQSINQIHNMDKNEKQSSRNDRHDQTFAFKEEKPNVHCRNPNFAIKEYEDLLGPTF